MTMVFLLLAGLSILAALCRIIILRSRSARLTSNATTPPLLESLARRFARGDIELDRYLEIRENLLRLVPASFMTQGTARAEHDSRATRHFH
jgi:uncharacterized membrane protein